MDLGAQTGSCTRSSSVQTGTESLTQSLEPRRTFLPCSEWGEAFEHPPTEVGACVRAGERQKSTLGELSSNTFLTTRCCQCKNHVFHLKRNDRELILEPL